MVEAEWMRILESADTTVEGMRAHEPVLSELCRVGKTSVAEEWAWAAIEALSARFSPSDVVAVAGRFLLAIGDSKDLRKQVAELYRTAFAGREGLDALVAEAGLAAGRPVRRALRTLEVCLPLEPGSYLAARDHEGAARVEAVDSVTWMFTFDDGTGSQALGAVELADRFRPASANEFRVMRHFTPDHLVDRLEKDPAAIVLDLCRDHEGTFTSDHLQALLVPTLLAEEDFKKWWTRARTALKKCPNVQVEGRSPYTISYVETPVGYDQTLWGAFESARGPLEQLQLVERYVRDCKTRKEPPAAAALGRCHEAARAHAAELIAHRSIRAGLAWAAAERIGELAGIDSESGELMECLKRAADVRPVLLQITEPALFGRACTALWQAKPGEAVEKLSAMFGVLPAELCDPAIDALVKGGWGAAELEALVQRILSAPLDHFGALLWLWDGPANETLAASVNRLTVLTRFLRTLDDCRRGESIDRERAKSFSLRARAVFSARRYERFIRCLQGIDPGMASPLRSQIAPLDNLGRAVREDLLDLLRRQFPSREVAPPIDPWKREDVLFVTQAAMVRKREEIEHHVNVTMRDNARAIGAAAEHGDLSENSEYKFALEERDLLRARLAQMNSELAIAQVLSPGDVATDFIGIGTRTVFQRTDNGARYEMTFLGPWDADHGKGAFNYQAPFAQSILGKRIGDTVRLPHTGTESEYQVVELSNGLVSAAQVPSHAAAS